MPTPADRVFRDFKRYTGDGLPNEPVAAPLPIGDPTSGVHNPRKSEIREWTNQVDGAVVNAQAAQTAAEAARDLAQAAAGDAVTASEVPIFSTAASVAGFEVNPSFTAFRTTGKTTPGDGKGRNYAEVAS